MRKFKIRIGSKMQTIFAEDSKKAKLIAQTNLGYKETDIVMAWNREFFNGSFEELEERCKLAREKMDNPIEVVSFWKSTPIMSEKKKEDGLEILRLDGYYDSIYFELGEEEKVMEIYNKLKKYNRPITPLEKYQASF